MTANTTYKPLLTLILSLISVSVAFPAFAEAAEPTENAARQDQAREHTKNATAAFNLGHFDEAAREYEAAYRSVPDPILLYNLGQAYRLGHQRDKALLAYRAFLRTAPPEAPNREQVEKRIAELEDLPGERKPEARSPIVATANSSHPASDDAAPDRAGWWLGRRWTWIAAGSASAFAVGAVVTGISMQSRFDDLNVRCGSLSQERTGCSEAEIDSVSTRRNMANVLWILAGTLTASAGVLFYVEGRNVAVLPVASGTNLGLVGRMGF